MRQQRENCLKKKAVNKTITEAVHPKCPPFICQFSARTWCKFSYFTNSKLTLGVKFIFIISLSLMHTLLDKVRFVQRKLKPEEEFTIKKWMVLAEHLLAQAHIHIYSYTHTHTHSHIQACTLAHMHASVSLPLPAQIYITISELPILSNSLPSSLSPPPPHLTWFSHAPPPPPPPHLSISMLPSTDKPDTQVFRIPSFQTKSSGQRFSLTRLQLSGTSSLVLSIILPLPVLLNLP